MFCPTKIAVDVAHNGPNGLHLGLTGHYDCCVLDLGLPRMDGLQVLSQWRGLGNDFPALALTVRDAWLDKVAAYRAGTGDFLNTPWKFL